MEAIDLKTDITIARVEDLDLPEGGDWATGARLDAIGRVTDAGLPVRRDEYWKYTNPVGLTAVEPAFTGALDNDIAAFTALDRVRLVFVDGVFDADNSDAMALDGVTIEHLSDVCAADIHWAKDVYGVLETDGQTPVLRPMAALNTAFAEHGLVIHATGIAAKPIEVVMRTTGADVMMHHVVKVDSGAAVTLIETGSAGARSNLVTEVLIADDGAFHHLRLAEDQDRHTLNHMFTRLGADATFKSFSLTAHGQLTRNECIIDMRGDDAAAHVAGACLGDGDMHHDDTVFITHDALNGESRQVFKKVLRNGAVSVFQGKILVKAGAQKTDGYQISQSLLLDDDSQFLAKPELEIYADDVACSHGSTSGAIDEQALFYLRSRGVPYAKAVDLLTLSFMAEAIEEIADEALADAVLTYLTDTLEARPKMPVTRDIVQAHTRPRTVMARLLDMGQREDRVLAMLMGACILFFVMQWPALARQAHITGDDLSQLIAYAFFGAVIILPLLMYGIAALVHLVAKALGGKGTWYTARLALFWSMLATTPVALLWGLMRGMNDNPAGIQLLAWVGTAVFLWIFISSMREGERG